MPAKMLDNQEKLILLKLARQSIESRIKGKGIPLINLEDYSPTLIENGASFVTLTIHGNLRGCIGALEPYQPLILDVCEHAVSAAFQDYRFPPVQAEEVKLLKIEISRLTIPQSLKYDNPEDLKARLRPHMDGVILRDGSMRATFLPQVWEQLPEVEEFLTHLCRKMGAPGGLWKQKLLDVQTYQVQEFNEGEFHELN